MTIASGTCGTNLTWVLNDDYSLVISGTGAMTEYGYSGAPWYSYRTQIISVSLPSGLTTIGSYAFDSCTSFESIIIPDSVTTIGESAFGECTSLASVTIPNSVTSIGRYAFMTCRLLTSTTIPSSVTTIGTYAFNGCTSLTSITFLKSSSTGISFGTGSFTLGTELKPVTATVYSLNNWASSVLNGYKNNYTTFNYTGLLTMVFTISSNDGQTTLGTYTYTTISETTVATVSSPAAVNLVRGSDVISIPITPPTGRTFFGLTSTPNGTATDVSDISGTSTVVSTDGTYTYYAVFGSIIKYLTYDGAPIQVDSIISDEDGNDIAETYAKKTDVPNITISSSAPTNPVEGDIWIQY